jgi:hypothetical protein
MLNFNIILISGLEKGPPYFLSKEIKNNPR